MTKRKKWPQEAEWARLDVLASLEEVRKLAGQVSRANREGDKLAVADSIFTIHRLATESTAKLKECREWD